MKVESTQHVENSASLFAIPREQSALPVREASGESALRYRYISFEGKAPQECGTRTLHFRRIGRGQLRSRHAAEEAGWSALEESVVNAILQRVQLSTKLYRIAPLRRRLRDCLRRLKCRSLSEALEELHSPYSPLQKSALNSILIGTTQFYRDPTVFDYVRHALIPRLLESRRGLRVLSLGCSEGAELYTVAALLAERDVLEASYLLGVDIRESAIQSAQAGTFSARLLGALPHDLLTPYFSPDGNQLYVTEQLRRHAHWQQGNILEFSGDGRPWDLILCRNVALYFEPASQERLWGTIWRQIADTGALVVGKGERPLGLKKCFSCVYRPPAKRQKDYDDE